MCCLTETDVADQTSGLSQQLQYTGAGQTSPSTDPVSPAPGRVATRVPVYKSPVWRSSTTGIDFCVYRFRGGHLSTWPPRRFKKTNKPKTNKQNPNQPTNQKKKRKDLTRIEVFVFIYYVGLVDILVLVLTD